MWGGVGGGGVGGGGTGLGGAAQVLPCEDGRVPLRKPAENVCVCACVRACVCVCARMCVCVCVRVV